MKRKLHDLFWKIPHNVRATICIVFKKHIGKSWLGRQTINEDGEGYCSICGTGALAKPHFVA